ncbi:hypothetical protein D9M68_537680 [compost metagenome]
MRFPADEYHRLLTLDRPADRRQHRRLAGLHQLEATQAELIAVDHFLDVGVGAGTRLDAVDLAVQLILELGDVREGLQPLLRGVGRHGQGGDGVRQAGLCEHLDLALVEERLDVVVHRRLPVTKEEVDLLLVDAGEDDLLRRGDLGSLVTEPIEQGGSHRRGGDDIRPANHPDTGLLATGWLGGEQRRTEQGENTATGECVETFH